MKAMALALLLAAFPVVAAAQGNVELYWNDCAGGATVMDRDFACTGPVDETYNLVMQFQLDNPIPHFVALTVYLDYQNDSHTALSPFWHYETGGCNHPVGVGRKGAALYDDVRLLPACAASFADPWDGDGTGGREEIAAYVADYLRPGQGHFILIDARLNDATALAAGLPYYAFHLRLNNWNRLACAGCADPGLIAVTQAVLESDDGMPPVRIYATNWVEVNRGKPVPTRPATWSRIKAQYR